MATRGAELDAQMPLKVLEDSDAGIVSFTPRSGESVVKGIEWKTVPERLLDDGGPKTAFEALPLEFSSVPTIEHLGRIVERYADKICIDDGKQQLTFGQLHAAVVKLAEVLSAHVPPGQAVGLLMPNCIWGPVAMLACMAAMRPCIPLNYRDPNGRNLEFSTDAALATLVGCGPNAAAEFAHMRWIDITDVPDPGSDSAVPPLPGSVDDPALILYTSGSTGRPKGIVNSQRALLQRVLQYVNSAHIAADDVFFPLSGPATIAGCREMLTSLLIGAKLFVVDIETIGLGGTRRAIASERATVIYSVPTLLRAMISAGQRDELQSVRILRIGGEKVLTADIEFFRQAMPSDCYVQIGYSSTETTGSQWFPPARFADAAVTAPAGYLLPGICYAVVDGDGASVPQGECGELVISSPFVSLGRWEKGSLVPSRIDPNDHTRRIHATGDLVFLDDQGVMHVVGRKDRQIKINGRRLEPAELEVAVRKIRGVADAVALVSAAGALVVFIALDVDSGIEFPGAIWQFIRNAVPASLHPKRLHQVANIPRLGSGKADAVSLLARDAALAESPPVLPAPHSADDSRHAKLAVEQVWRRVLNTRNAAGRWDEAGGDSLSLLRFVMELEGLIGRQLDLKAFTIDADADRMAAAVTDALWQNTGPDPLQATRPPLFLVPGSIGYGPSLSAFGATFSGIAHVSTIRYPDLGAMIAAQSTIADMAAYAMDQIRQIQPTGDVRLVSYSLGGAVAFEIARQSIAEGRTVAFFGVLDTNLGSERGGFGEAISRLVQRIWDHRVTVYRVACRSLSKAIIRLGRGQLLARVLELKLWKYFPATRFMLKLEGEEVLRMRAFRNWTKQAHHQLPIAGTVFSCRRPRLSSRLGWDRLVEQLEVIPISGEHLNLMIEPHLSINQPLIERALIATYRKPAVGEAYS